MRAISCKLANFLTTATATLLVSSNAMAISEACSPTSVSTCGLPFPSNYWSMPDSQSPTGIRLAVDDGVVSDQVLSELPVQDGFTPSGVFEGGSGFSSATGVLFEFTADIDASQLAEDGADAVVAYDLTTGQSVPIRVQFSEYAASNENQAAQVLEIFPRDRWAFGHDILVAVTSQLDLTGPVPTIDQLVNQGTAAQQAFAMQTVSELEQLGFDTSEVLNATRFTIRPAAEVIEPIEQVIWDVWNRDHPVRNIDVQYNLVNIDIAALVTGELLTYNYRTNDGTGVVDFNKEPMEQWIEFRLTIPKTARETPAAVALYAHGLGANKESDSLMQAPNAELGVATFSVDFPNHGSRAEADGGAIFSVLTPDQLAKPIGMVNQNAIDFASAHRALITALNEIDVVGKSTWTRWCSNCPDGQADIDASKVFMQGTSLGGVLGSAYGSLSPDLDGAMYQVTGVGITNILSMSTLWNGLFSNLIPPSATGAEAALLRTAIQQMLDYGDSINYIERFRQPAPGIDAKPLFILMGANDSIVPNPSSVALANIVDMPIVGEPLVEMPGVDLADDFVDSGYGLRHYKPVIGTVPLIWEGEFAEAIAGATAHLIFTRLEAEQDQQSFTERFILSQY